MSRPKTHYSLVIKNHFTGDRLELELIDLPVFLAHRFRIRVNGQWVGKCRWPARHADSSDGEQNNRHEAGSRLAGETLGGAGSLRRTSLAAEVGQGTAV